MKVKVIWDTHDCSVDFLAMGVDELSVSPGSILPLRKIILETDVEAYKKSKQTK